MILPTLTSLGIRFKLTTFMSRSRSVRIPTGSLFFAMMMLPTPRSAMSFAALATVVLGVAVRTLPAIASRTETMRFKSSPFFNMDWVI